MYKYIFNKGQTVNFEFKLFQDVKGFFNKYVKLANIITVVI